MYRNKIGDLVDVSGPEFKDMLHNFDNEFDIFINTRSGSEKKKDTEIIM
jgi:hypothetical protein